MVMGVWGGGMMHRPGWLPTALAAHGSGRAGQAGGADIGGVNEPYRSQNLRAGPACPDVRMS